MSGASARAATVSHWGPFRHAVLKTADSMGMEITDTCNPRQTTKESSILGLLNNPIRNTERSLRTLKACTSWDRLSTANAIVLPTVTSKYTRPMVKASREMAPIKQPSMAML